MRRTVPLAVFALVALLALDASARARRIHNGACRTNAISNDNGTVARSTNPQMDLVRRTIQGRLQRSALPARFKALGLKTLDRAVRTGIMNHDYAAPQDGRAWLRTTGAKHLCFRGQQGRLLTTRYVGIRTTNNQATQVSAMRTNTHRNGYARKLTRSVELLRRPVRGGGMEGIAAVETVAYTRSQKGGGVERLLGGGAHKYYALDGNGKRLGSIDSHAALRLTGRFGF